MASKLIDNLKTLLRIRRSAATELEFCAERDFTFKYYAGEIYSQDYWKKAKASFPFCPKCSDNQSVKIVSYGLKTGTCPAWFKQYVSTREHNQKGSERWTCGSCQKDFLGHKANRTGTETQN